MTRRAAAHDYTATGIYHITLHVADGMGQPLGAVVGNPSAPDGSADAPRTALSPVGRMVEHELLHSIHAHYPMIVIQDYVIMPEHLHFIAVVQDKILSRNGKTMTLGQVIAGFKKGCNRRYWELTGQADGSGCMDGSSRTEGSGQIATHTSPAGPAAPASATGPTFGPTFGSASASGSASGPGPASAPSSVSVPGGLPAGASSAPYKVPSDGTSGRQPLFSAGFCDVMPVDAAQLATQRAYIAGNPRSRLLRSSNRALLSVQRAGVATALTPSALRGYLHRECGAALTAEAWEELAAQLLLAPDCTVTCDSFGPRRLLEARLLPVVCHRKDAARFAQQKARCLEEAARGAVLVSARIAKGEQEIMNESVNHGFPVIIIADNGFPDRYHPSQERLDHSAAGRLLIVTPWQYRYRAAADTIHVPRCKAMNCVAQALCRTKDTWWKEK